MPRGKRKPLPEDFASYQREAKRRFLKRRKAGRPRKESYQYGRPQHAEPKGYADIRKTPKPVSDPRFICNNYKSQCRKCGYSSSQTFAGNISCNFILIEGHMRGCPVENCKRFRPGRNRVRKEYTFQGQWEVAFDDDEEELELFDDVDEAGDGIPGDGEGADPDVEGA